MPPRKDVERATLPTVNREAAEILEQFLNRRLENVKAKIAHYEVIREEIEEKRLSRLKVHDGKATASCEAVDESLTNSCERLNSVDSRPHSLPADFRNKINSDADIKLLLNSIKKDVSLNPSVKCIGRKSGPRGVDRRDGSVCGSPSDSSDNYPDEDWLRQKPRKKKNFFKRTKERLQHAFKLQQNHPQKSPLKILKSTAKDNPLTKDHPPTKDHLHHIHTDIGVLSFSDVEARKRGKRKKSKRPHNSQQREVDGYSSATRSESTTPGKQSDLFIDQHSCNLKRVQSDEVFKHRRVDLKKTLPVTSQEEPTISVVGHFRDKILNPIRRSFRRSKSKGSESGTNDTDKPVDPNYRRPKPDIPRPLLPGDDNYHFPKLSDNDSKNAVKVFKEILDFTDGISGKSGSTGLSPRVESPPYVSLGKVPEPIYADIDNAHSQTSFEDIDEPDQEDIWVLRVPDSVGGGCREDLFLPGLSGGAVPSPVITKNEFSYKTLTYEERKSNASVYNRGFEEKAGVYGVIAQKLATLADTCVARIDSESTGDSDSSRTQEKTTASGGLKKDPPSVERLNSLEKQIITCLRQSGDKIAETHDFPTSTATQLIQHVGYSTFKKTMQNTIGNEPGWDQVAMLFYVANSAMQLAGASGALASKVKENTLRYFEDKFAEWIVGQGGWDSMLEDTSTPDTELD